VAKAKKNTPSVEEIEFTLGEQRFGMKASAKTYFFYVTPTGREVAMKECEHAHIAWMKGGREESDGTRITELGINVLQPITIKMVSMLSQFGSAKNYKMLFLDLSPEAEKVEIMGLGPSEDTRFGRFIGRATINEELSGMTDKDACKIFKVTTLAGPRVERAEGVRSLIISN
jgi:hypothetical protein